MRINSLHRPSLLVKNVHTLRNGTVYNITQKVHLINYGALILYYRLEWFEHNFIRIRTSFYFSFWSMLNHLKYHVHWLRCFCHTVSFRCIQCYVHLSTCNFCIQYLFVAYDLAVVCEWGKCIIIPFICISLQLSHINYFWIIFCILLSMCGILFWLIDWLIDWLNSHLWYKSGCVQPSLL